MNKPSYRDRGAIGALLDEYEKAIEELKALISTVSAEELTKLVDHQTKDDDCRSIQSILTHVVAAGYNYAVYIRRNKGEKIEFARKQRQNTIAAYMTQLDAMFSANEKLFDDYPDIQLEEYDSAKKMLTNWGQRFDTDQLMEHAIVHILRHRRQIERFLLKLR